jgi:transposase
MYQLKVNRQQSIVALHEQGWSGRRIARELGLDRGTVRIYLAGISKPATPHTGSADPPTPIRQNQPPTRTPGWWVC